MRKYKLQTLFDLREKTKEFSEKKFIDAQNQLRNERALLEELEKVLDTLIAHRKSKTQDYIYKNSAGISCINDIQIQENHLSYLKQKEEVKKKEILQQKTIVKKCEQSVQGTRKSMLKATQDFKIIEKLRETWRFELNKELEKKADEQADEISQSQFARAHT